MKKKLIAALLAATVAAGTMPSAGALLDGFTASRTYSNQFTDVPTNAWYYNSVKSAYNLGLVNGSSATTYSPNKEVTIAELYAMASRIHAAYYGNEIQPVDGAWFAPYVEYSQEYLDTGSHDNAYSYSDGVLVANLPAARWYFACISYAAVDPDEFNQLNHVLSGSIEDRKGFLENIQTILNIRLAFIIQIAGQVTPRQLELFEPPVNADFIKDIPQAMFYLLNRLFVSLK